MSSLYKRVSDDRADRTHKIGDLISSYSQLKAVLGEPDDGEGYKVSMMWVLEDSKGRIFTIYDWKQTSLFTDYEGNPTPEEFKKLRDVDFSIGGHSKDGLEELFKFLKEKNAGVNLAESD